MNINSGGNSNQEIGIKEHIEILPFYDVSYTLQHRETGHTKTCTSNKANLQ